MDLVIDIETIPREIPQSIKDAKLEKLKVKTKDETKLKEQLEEWERDDWCFQPGASRPICVGLMHEQMNEPITISSDSELELCTMLHSWTRDFIKEHGGTQHRLVGFNLKKFDLPQLMITITMINKSFPFKFGKWDVIDLMKDPFGYDTGMYSLAYYAEIFGLGKKSGSGADVQKLWKEDLKNGTYQVADYCKQDVALTMKVFQKYKLFYRF